MAFALSVSRVCSTLLPVRCLLTCGAGLWFVPLACSSPPANNAPPSNNETTSTNATAESTAPTHETSDGTPFTSEPSPSTSGSSGELGEPIAPGTPVVLADGLVFPARLCLGSKDDLLFPHRLGYPDRPGMEELWRVSRAGGNAQPLATLGSVTGCSNSSLGLWVSSNSGSAVVQVDEETGSVLKTLDTPTTPVQVASGTTELLVSLTAGGSGAAVIAVDPEAGPKDVLWSRSGAPLVSWLKALAPSLFFTANDYQQGLAWVVHVDLTTRAVRELFTSASELGAVDANATHVYFTDHDRGEVRSVFWEPSSTMDSTLVATLPDAWSLLLEGDYLYVGTRPDYCTGTEGKLYRVSVTGEETTLLAENLNCPSQMVADARGLYWVNAGSWAGPATDLPAPADGSVMFLPR